MSSELVIEKRIPELLALLSARNQLLVSAPPGAGKTTVVPLSLLDQEWSREKKILLLEPRRVAAVAAAEFMSERAGTAVGELVGYRTRAASRSSSRTRVEVVTEGILTRMLLDDPGLEEYAAVIFDEFHERSIHADLGLALCLQSQETLRPDLRIVIMSATVDIAELQKMLASAVLFSVEGRSFPVEVTYRPVVKSLSLEEQVSAAIHQVYATRNGDVLVFLPGRREIQAAQRFLGKSRELSNSDICTLSGETPIGEQRGVLRGASAERRRIILSTNIAETSVTIPGVTIVIDSGLMRVSQLDHSTGIPKLVTVRVAQTNATQRAGRAGRTAPGACVRLWSEAEQRALRPFGEPEILRADIAPLLLNLAEWGVRSPSDLKFLSPPSEAAVDEGWRLLNTLGAVDTERRITSLGKQIARLGVHPRLGSMLIRAKLAGVSAVACDLAALQEEEDSLRKSGGEIDVAARWHALQRFRERGGESRVLERVARNAQRLGERVKNLTLETFRGGLVEADLDSGLSGDQHLGLLLAWAYPDRIAKRRAEKSEAYLLANGVGAKLPQGSAMSRHEYFVAATVVGGAERAMVHLAEALSSSDIETLLESIGTSEQQTTWDSNTESVRAFEEERLGAISVRRRYVEPDPEKATQIILDVIRAKGLDFLPWSKDALSLRERASWALDNGLVPLEFPDLRSAWLLDNLEHWLVPYLAKVSSLKELRKLDMGQVLRNLLSFQYGALLESLAPATLVLPTGTHASISYDSAPTIEVMLQELFGVVDSPCIANGKVPLSIALLSPARRPLQITKDLRSFWTTTYQSIRGEMRARYPKHLWPEKPLECAPHRGPRRKPRTAT